MKIILTTLLCAAAIIIVMSQEARTVITPNKAAQGYGTKYEIKQHEQQFGRVCYVLLDGEGNAKSMVCM